MKYVAKWIGCGLLAALVFGPGAVAAEEAKAKALIRERIEWCDIWFTDAEKSELPRVLMIGDSITRGYFDSVESQLGGKVYCGRYTSSRSICDPVYFEELRLVIRQYKFAVIHFNHGLHGWGYTEEEYAAAFDRLLTVLREEGQGAQLIWASTTPVAKKEDLDRVVARNAIAAERVNKAGIPTDDLFTLLKDHPDYLSEDGVHFKPGGKEVQAKAVTESINKALESGAK